MAVVIENAKGTSEFPWLVVRAWSRPPQRAARHRWTCSRACVTFTPVLASADCNASFISQCRRSGLKILPMPVRLHRDDAHVLRQCQVNASSPQFSWTLKGPMAQDAQSLGPSINRSCERPACRTDGDCRRTHCSDSGRMRFARSRRPYSRGSTRTPERAIPCTCK